jgi:hypothetical protein
MSLWYCSDCRIAYGPQPHCPRCGEPGTLVKPQVKFISTEQAEQCDIMICREWTMPLLLPDNQCGQCAVCGHFVQHRPDAPRKPMKVCMGCAPAVIRQQ